MINEIYTFNEEVIRITTDKVSLLGEKEFEWLRKALEEEMYEMEDAYTMGNIVGVVDGALDLVYFAIGALRRMGLTREQAQQCFMAIHDANMTKKRGSQDKRGGLETDAIKPESFVPPEKVIKQILGL